MSLSVVAVIWSLLSLIVAVSFWLCLLQPRWFVHSDAMTSLGVFSYCYHDDDDVVTTLAPPGGGAPGLQQLIERCQVYGGPRFHFSKLPSAFWQASCVLLGSASVLSSAAALMSIVTLCLPRRHDFTVAAVTGYVQIIAGRWNCQWRNFGLKSEEEQATFLTWGTYKVGGPSSHSKKWGGGIRTPHPPKITTMRTVAHSSRCRKFDEHGA